MIIRIPDTKNNVPRAFIIEEKFMQIVKKYMALRPKDVPTYRFFLNYKNDKCTRQVIGKNKFAKTPKEIAQYLGLPYAHLYTGHCFRRTSATLLLIKEQILECFSNTADGSQLLSQKIT